jgi:hypothetical protein
MRRECATHSPICLFAHLPIFSFAPLADKYFNGDLQAAQKRLRDNGLARQGPVPCNHAMSQYKPIGE